LPTKITIDDSLRNFNRQWNRLPTKPLPATGSLLDNDLTLTKVQEFKDQMVLHGVAVGR